MGRSSAQEIAVPYYILFVSRSTRCEVSILCSTDCTRRRLTTSVRDPFGMYGYVHTPCRPHILTNALVVHVVTAIMPLSPEAKSEASLQWESVSRAFIWVCVERSSKSLELG